LSTGVGRGRIQNQRMARGLRRNRSGGRWALLALGAVLVAIIGVAAFAAMANGTPLGGAASPGPCTPQPCLNLQGFTMWVSNVSDSGGVVRMQVRFRNASSSTHAAPEDLRLTDSTKQSTPATQVPPGCTHWGRTEFSNGATYGPITVCFRPTNVNPPLTLNWNPDMGLFCCQADLRTR